MHGIIFKSLKDFVVSNHDHETWDAVRREAGLEQRVYLPIQTYEEGELVSLVRAAADLTDEPIPDLLEAYGEFAAGLFLDTYDNVVREDWDALDLVANTEEGIHEVLRAHNPNLDPPELVCRREDDAQVTILYRSDRRLCFVAKGIVRGVADHYGERVSVTERACMHDGSDHCRIVVRR